MIPLQTNLISMNSFVSYNGYSFEYEEYGSGEQLLIAFHGFDRHASDFKVFESSLGFKYKIISFNLFYHGNSLITKANLKKEFTLLDLKGLIDELLRERHQNEFSLLAYSLGGKIALCCIQLYPGKIRDVYLFAPDGIVIPWWYTFASNNKIGQGLFKTISNNSELFLKFTKLLQKSGIITEKLFKFVSYQMGTEERREKIYNIWLIFRKIIPDIHKIQKIINSYDINIQLFFGKFDVVIPLKLGVYFAKGIKKKDSLHILDTGHNLITEKTNSLLTTYIKN